MKTCAIKAVVAPPPVFYGPVGANANYSATCFYSIWEDGNRIVGGCYNTADLKKGIARVLYLAKRKGFTHAVVNDGSLEEIT